MQVFRIFNIFLTSECALKNIFLYHNDKLILFRFGYRVWCQLLDRRQQRLDLVLISVDSFALEEDKEHLNLSPHCLPPVNVNVIYSETTEVWINIHDILHFFPSEDKSKLTFLWASEESGFRHLYQITVALTAQLANCVDEAVPLDGNKNKLNQTE